MVVVIVLASALLHATWNALLRVEPDKQASVTVVITVAGVVSAVLAAVQLGLGDVTLPTAAGAGWAIAAGGLEAAYFVALSRALATGALGPVYTVSRGGAVLLVWPASILVWGEPVTGLQLAGSATLLVGLAASSASRVGAPRVAMVWAAAAALFIAGYHLSYKAALACAAAPTVTFAIAMAVATAANLARIGGAGRREAITALRTRWPRLVGTGVICAAGFLLFMFGLRVGGAGEILTLRNTSVLFATAMGWAIGEPPGRRQLAGAALVVAGAVLLGIGR